MKPRGRSRLNLSFLVLAAFAVSGMGCPETMVPPPPMYLETLDLGPTVTNIKVVNGAGETLYDGRRPSGGQISANPTPEQLDGTMTITRTYSDGSTRQQTLTYEAGKPVNIGYSSASNDYYIKPSPKPVRMPHIYGALAPSFDFVDRPDTAIVRRDDGGQLAGFLKADNNSRNPAFNGTIGYKFETPLWGAKVGVELNGSYYSSKAKESYDQVPANGGQLAVFGPLTGGGVAFPVNNDITDLRYSSDYTAWSFQPRLNKSYGVGTIYGTPVRMNSYLGFNYGKNEDDQELSGNVPLAGLDFMSGSWIDNWYYGPEGGFYAAWDWCPRTKVTVGGFVNFNVNDLKAKRMITLSNGLNGTDEFTDTKFTVGGGANIGLNYKIGDRITAKVGFQYEYANNAPVVNVDRQTGEASVDAEGADIYSITIGAKYNF